MGFTWTGILSLLATQIMGWLSPHIREKAIEMLQDLHEKALATPNPLDDLATGLLLTLVGGEPRESRDK